MNKLSFKKTAALALSAAVLCISSCGSAGEEQTPPASVSEPGETLARIMVTSDCHLMSDSVVAQSSKYGKGDLTTDGRLQECDEEIVRGLVDLVNRELPDALCITGDLSFNGERSSNLMLADILSGVDGRVKVLVVPGNHDLNNHNTRLYIGESVAAAAKTGEEDFRQIYSDFGYSGALSYDGTSLSYVWEIREGVWALMLDTTRCRFNDALGENQVGGFVDEDTLAWIEDNLKKAAAAGAEVVAFGHHNLFDHVPLFSNGYTLNNAEDLFALFDEYGVKLYFSGHLHVQSIVGRGGVTDIASEALLDYSCSAGDLLICENAYVYGRKSVAAEGSDLRERAKENFKRRYYEKQISSYEKVFGERADEALELMCEMNALYFDGDYEAVNALVDENEALALEIRDKIESSYLNSIMGVPPVSQSSLTIAR